jgi:ribosomal protein S12 methylthiotransferase accessory factor
VIAETLAPALRRAVSPYTGIVRSLEECLHLPSEPPLFRVAAEIGRSRELLGSSLDHVAGIGGAGSTRSAAVAAAVGEALERYSLTYVAPDRLVPATAEELPDAVAPEAFALFSERQHADPSFPFRPFRSDTRVPWVDGWRIRDGARAWLPAELVFLGETAIAGCDRVGYATSSGAACAPTVEEALERGLCEVLERDAFMIAWASRLSLPRLDWSDDDELLEIDRSTFAVTGLDYAAVDMSSFHGLPSFLGVVRAPRLTTGALGVGAGTGATVERAWWKALSEAFACRAAGVKLALLRPGQSFGAHGGGVVSFEDHIQYYADRRRAAAAAFLDASPRTVTSRSIARLDEATAEDRVSTLCDRVRRAGCEAYAVDATSPDVRDLGLVVAKVVTPGLCSLDVPHGARFLGGRRLYEAAAELGLRAAPLAEHDVNPDPHPFP